jgi:hypothetical protein
MSRTRMIGTTLLLLGGAVACSDTGGGPASGRTQILLTDSPFPYDRIARVAVHIVRVQVAQSPDSLTQNWVTVAEPNRTIDLLELQSGATTVLGETAVDAGTVGAVRVVINTALSSVTDTAGQAVTVHWPVSGELALHAYVQQSLALFVEGTPHPLVIDFDVGRSFEDVTGDGTLYFIPWIRALDGAGAGAVAGVVRGPADDSASWQPMANVAVTVLAGDPHAAPYTWWKVATGRSDAQGRYRVAFLLLGQYIVRAEPLGVSASGCMDTTNVLVTSGATATLNLDLPYAPGTCARHTGGGGGPDTTGTDTSSTDTTTVGGPVATVTVTAWPQTPAVGDSLGAWANLANAQGASLYGRPVTWTVSDTAIVGITGAYGQSLILRAKAAGAVTVTATSEGVSGSRVITVH